MSQENVEVVRGAVEAFEHDGLEGSLRHYHPEIEWSTTGVWIEAATYRGHEGVRRYFGHLDDELDELRFEVEELIDAGQQVILAMRAGGRGKTSGAPVEGTMYAVCSLRDGMVWRIHNYTDKADALEAAGLRE